ncbi:MAG: DoxX family membrane protein [Lactobacillaceae bacterium]|jgi:thiosulfate dehydrogenase [quinone] large subunit|nr:DoxX family membrane protein [Lactobacillaceae bacterium]
MWNLIRENKIVSYFLTVLRVLLGATWLIDGWNKLTMSGGFHLDSVIKMLIAQPVTSTFSDRAAFPWFNAFVKWTTSNGQSATDMSLWANVLLWGEIIVGLLLILGALTTIASLGAIALNLTYLGFGLISKNPTELVIAFVILTAGYNAGKWGLDYFISPWVRQKIR